MIVGSFTYGIPQLEEAEPDDYPVYYWAVSGYRGVTLIEHEGAAGVYGTDRLPVTWTLT